MHLLVNLCVGEIESEVVIKIVIGMWISIPFYICDSKVTLVINYLFRIQLGRKASVNKTMLIGPPLPTLLPRNFFYSAMRI